MSEFFTQCHQGPTVRSGVLMMVTLSSRRGSGRGRPVIRAGEAERAAQGNNDTS